MIMHSGGSRLTTLSLVVVWVLIGCSSPTGVAPIEERAQPPSRDLRLHIVDHNETLYSVAFRYEKDYRDLAEINGLYPPYTLQFQQRIYLLAEAVPDSVRQPIQVRDSELTQSAVSPSIATREPASAPVRTAPVTSSSVSSATPSTSSTPSPSVPTTPPVSTSVQAPARTEAPGPTPRSGAAAPQEVTLPATVSDWVWPAGDRVVQSFGGSNPVSKGISLAAAEGTPVHASAGGQVVYAGSGLRGYGNLIILKHSELFLSAYAHNSELHVEEGDWVAQGETIALSGINAQGDPRLYFEIRRDGKPVDPIRYLPSR